MSPDAAANEVTVPDEDLTTGPGVRTGEATDDSLVLEVGSGRYRSGYHYRQSEQ